MYQFMDLNNNKSCWSSYWEPWIFLGYMCVGLGCWGWFYVYVGVGFCFAGNYIAVGRVL